MSIRQQDVYYDLRIHLDTRLAFRDIPVVRVLCLYFLGFSSADIAVWHWIFTRLLIERPPCFMFLSLVIIRLFSFNICICIALPGSFVDTLRVLTVSNRMKHYLMLQRRRQYWTCYSSIKCTLWTYYWSFDIKFQVKYHAFLYKIPS